MPYEIVRFPYDGTIDADGHVLEPATLWAEYLENQYQSRAMRIDVDEDGSDGTVRVAAANLNCQGLTVDFSGGAAALRRIRPYHLRALVKIDYFVDGFDN